MPSLNVKCPYLTQTETWIFPDTKRWNILKPPSLNITWESFPPGIYCMCFPRQYKTFSQDLCVVDMTWHDMSSTWGTPILNLSNWIGIMSFHLFRTKFGSDGRSKVITRFPTTKYNKSYNILHKRSPSCTLLRCVSCIPPESEMDINEIVLR